MCLSSLREWPMLQEIKRENLTKKIIKALGEYIIVNHLGSGDKLPTEMELAEKFHVGRNAVREALKSLEMIGLVQGKPGIGTVLSHNGVEPFLLPYIFGLVLNDVNMDFLSELRLVVEQGAVRLAVQHASHDDIVDVMIHAEKLDNVRKKAFVDGNKDNEYEVGNLEAEFHFKLIKLSQNPILIKLGSLWDVIFSRAQDAGDLSFAAKAGRVSKERGVTHQELVEAIEKRDGDVAANLIKIHLRYWLQRDQGFSKETLLKIILT